MKKLAEVIGTQSTGTDLSCRPGRRIKRIPPTKIDLKHIARPIYEGVILKVISRTFFLIVWEKTKKGYCGGPEMIMKYAITPAGDYVGDTRTAFRLVRKYGIAVFERRTATSAVVSIGYSPIKKKWFGWSHRAIFGFKTKTQAARFAASVS